ncbi:MAG TPA: hypothetical protein VFL83_07265 [Anaeromyxobacter sp.]|nr:hypothetical protein [Anaeromyxobacter sp.]
MPVPVSPDVAALLARDPVWRPGPAEAEPWLRAAAEPGAPAALLHEVRWWRARDAADREEWGEVTALAAEGLGEASSEREGVRLAFLHAASGDLEQAEHLVAQAVQTVSAEDLPRRFAEWCAREGLAHAAGRFG